MIPVPCLAKTEKLRAKKQKRRHSRALKPLTAIPPFLTVYFPSLTGKIL